MSKQKIEVCAGCGQKKPIYKWWAVILPHGIDKSQTKPYCKACYEQKVVSDALEAKP